jgi:hypothetical protein
MISIVVDQRMPKGTAVLVGPPKGDDETKQPQIVVLLNVGDETHRGPL